MYSARRTPRCEKLQSWVDLIEDPQDPTVLEGLNLPAALFLQPRNMPFYKSSWIPRVFKPVTSFYYTSIVPEHLVILQIQCFAALVDGLFDFPISTSETMIPVDFHNFGTVEHVRWKPHFWVTFWLPKGKPTSRSTAPRSGAWSTPRARSRRRGCQTRGDQRRPGVWHSRLVPKGEGESILNGEFKGEIICWWMIVHWHVWFSEGSMGG